MSDTPGIKCPACGWKRHKVRNTRPHGECQKRWRECLHCGARFKTYEAPTDVLARVVLAEYGGEIEAALASLDRARDALAALTRDMGRQEQEKTDAI